MSDFAMLVHYDYCTGCKSCEISCKNEKGYAQAPYGVTVLENGPYDLGGGKWEWDYVPAFNSRCDMCADRQKAGEKPPCVIHCLANCLEVGPADELLASFMQKPHKAFIVKS